MKKGLALLLAVSMIVGLLPTFALAADLGLKADKTYIVLAPGNFDDNGGWKTATEDETNITYMIAGTSGEPTNAEAKMKIVLPADGSYKIYAFSRDYETAPGSRFFDVKLGDFGTYRLGNHAQAGWHWQSSEAFSETGGETEIAVVDCKGNYARCAMVVITNDLNYAPAETNDVINVLAEKHYKPGDTTYTPVDEAAG